MVEDIPKFLLQECTCDLSVIKNGGESCVFKGTHPLLPREVAIKMWTKAYDNKDDEQKIRREVILLMRNMTHENIIGFLGILIDEQSKCIGYIMPYMIRGSLDDVIHDTDGNHDDIYTSKQVTSWITQISDGLSYLHSNNIIHRDIKPNNILVGNSCDDVKLSDFGIARSLEHITHSLTKEIGTPVYMDPEMSKTEDYNSSVDIYSLSITIWEILHRRTPFDHIRTHNSNIFELYNKISNGERPELGNDLSKQVADLLKKLGHIFPGEKLILDAGISIFLRDQKLMRFFNFLKMRDFKFQKETILLLGGRDGSKLLDSLVVLKNSGESKESWKKINIKLPYKIMDHGAQFLKNSLYVFGGQSEKNEILNLTYKLSKTLKWEKVADMNDKRRFISNSNLVLNDRIWVLGGWNGKEVRKSVEMYDPSRNKWKYMKEMNHCRSGAAAAVVNGKIFCCGGWYRLWPLNSTECYDPSSNLWTFISSMPLCLVGLCAVAMDGNLIVVGGSNGKEESRNVLELDTSNKNAEWIAKPSMSDPRRSFSTTKVDNKIFVCGGFSNGWVLSFVEMFDGEVWKQGPKLIHFRCSATSTVIPINFGKYLEYGITRFGRTTHTSNKMYLHGMNQNMTLEDSNQEEEAILLLGGGDEKKVLDHLVILKNNEENWKELNIKLPYPISLHGAQFLNNSLYIFGGEQGGETLNFTYKLSEKLKWEKMADMNQKREGISNNNVILNYQIWVLGGSNGMRALNNIEKYDPSRDEWKYMKEMSQCRDSAAAAVVNGKIFCCGGWNGKELLNSTECYDPSSDIWTFISNMPQPLWGLGAVAIDKKLIVIGGLTSTGESRHVWELNTSDKNAEWIAKPSMLHPRGYFSITKIGNEIFVCGGYSSENLSPFVEIFDGEVWMQGPNPGNYRLFAASTVIPVNFGKYLEYGITRFGRTKTKSKATYLRKTDETLTVEDINIEKETILLLGGFDGEKKLDSLLILGNNEENWKELNIKLPYPIYRHGAQLLNNVLYIFGGQNQNNEILYSTYKLSLRFQWKTLSKKLIWKKMADLKSERFCISNSSVILNGRIWVLGGRSEKERLKSVEMYDPSINEWEYMKQMNIPRSGAAAAVVNGKIFCCGGFDGKEVLSSIECYDPSSDVWTFILNMPLPLGGHDIVPMDGNLIVIGGCNRSGESRSVWELDTSNTNAEWIEKSGMSLLRSYFSIARIDDKIFVCEGESEEIVVDNVEIFDGEVWKNGPKLPSPRSDGPAVVIPTNFAKYLK